MAHARRMFYEARDNDKAIAEYALEQIGLLNAIERRAKQQELTPAQIEQLRQRESVPVLESLGQWMKETYLKALPKSSIGKALGYSIQRWPELMLYATDGKLNIDNNPVENSIRPVAIGRKNYLFGGSHEAAKRSAMLYSLMGTCKLHGINPFIWLRDVLQRINNHPINKIAAIAAQLETFGITFFVELIWLGLDGGILRKQNLLHHEMHNSKGKERAHYAS